MTIREIIEKGRKLEELSSSPYREKGVHGNILNSADKIILSSPYADCQADINFILHCANTHAALTAQIAKHVEALKYYSILCAPGCSPCDHLQARIALKEAGYEDNP